MNFNNGNDNNNNKSNSRYVRAVRGGKGSMLSVESVHAAYLDCRKRKRGTFNAIRFEYDLVGNLMAFARELQPGTYRPSRSVCFITSTPKLREVFAADFRDRVVHHLLVRQLEPVWEPCFIHDSYACRVGKGAHAAVNRLRTFMGKVTRSRKRPAWFMQLDIRSFFMSIDKNLLFNLLKSKTSDPVLLDLIGKVIFHDPVRDYVFKGDPALLGKVPPHKSLFHVGPDRGLPIGNLTSQFFANVYLNQLDQFVKHHLRCRFYIRYVDDFILLDPSETRLMEWRVRIESYLAERLGLKLKNRGIIRRVSDGADFLGYIVRPDYTLVRGRVVNNLKRSLNQLRDRIFRQVRIGGVNGTEMDLSPETTARVRQVLASYLGHFKHADSHKLVLAVFRRHSWLDRLFLLQDGKLIDRLRYKGLFRTFRAQAGFFKSRIPESVQLIQVGSYLEAYDEDALLLHRLTGIALKEKFRRMRLAAGFPLRLENRFIAAVLRTGRSVALIRETGPGKYVKERNMQKLAYKLESGCPG